jgi:hypothetical protein
LGQKTANVTPIFSMELQNKLRFFALFLFDYRRVTLFTPVTPIFFVFFFFIFLGGYSIGVTNDTGSHLKLR